MHLRNDSPSFHPVHARIRGIGPWDLHRAEGRGLFDAKRSRDLTRDTLVEFSSKSGKSNGSLIEKIFCEMRFAEAGSTRWVVAPALRLPALENDASP